jgi:galactose mutarotase-like enzyme
MLATSPSGDNAMSYTPSFITLTDEIAGAAIPTRVQIAPERGGIVTSFAVGDRELLYLDQSTLADPTKNVRGGIPILFPTPGKLDGDAWQRDGHAGKMTQHGFARRMPWVVEPRANTSPENSTVNCVSMSLASSPETLASYPWPFHATLSYALNGGSLRITMRVRNTGNAHMPYALGFHPYFHVKDKSHASIRTQATRAYNNVTKRPERFVGFDLTAPEVDIHLLDHNSDVASLRVESGSYIGVRASHDFGVWVVWTLAGKEFVCVEPWTAPGNALNTGDRLIGLAPGASHESWLEIAYARVV